MIYPIYILSKGRSEKLLTVKFLDRENVPFYVVVEPQEADAYAAAVGAHRVVVMPTVGGGTATTVRNFIKQYSIARGEKRHWQLDDNIRCILGYTPTGKLKPTSCLDALTKVEELVDRYTNVAIAGLRHHAFPERTHAFFVNKQVYSCVLVDNQYPFKWRGISHHDTDYSLQVLASGLCTILINAFCIEKAVSMSMKGGMTDAYLGDGKLQKARELQRRWPGLGIGVIRRNGRPSASMGQLWTKFTQPLIPR